MDESKELNQQRAEQEGAAPELQPAPEAQRPAAEAAPQVQQPAVETAPAAGQPAPQAAAQYQQAAPQAAAQYQQAAPQGAPQYQQAAPQAAPQYQQAAPQAAPQFQQAAPQAAPQFQQAALQVAPQYQQAAAQGAPQFQQAGPQAAPQAQQQGGASQGAAAGEKNSVFNLMFRVLFSPGHTMQAVARERRIGSAIAIVLLLGLFNVLVGTLALNQNELRGFAQFLDIYGPDQDFFVAMVRQMTLVFGIIFVFVQVVLLFVRAGFYKLLGEMVGERNGYDGLTMVATLGYAAMPTIFSPVLNLISGLLGNFLLSLMFSLIIWVWSAVLTIWGIKAALQCHGGKAFLVYIIPVLVVVLISVMASVMFGFSMAFLPLNML